MGNALLLPQPLNWHITTNELKRQVEDKGWTFHIWPDIDFDPMGKDVVALYNGVYPQTPDPVPVVEKSVLLILEPPVVKPRTYERLFGWHHRRILTFVRSAVDGKRVFYVPFPVPSYTKDLSRIRRDKYICAISSNKMIPGSLHGDRRLAYLGWGKDLDLWGWGWHTDPEMMDKVNYCGPVNDKVAKLAEYQFAIAFENQIIEGYTSEKYWHCVQAGTVPLYRGWRPDYTLDYCTEVNWSKNVVAHLEAVCE
jgi:hypothetical protein